MKHFLCSLLSLLILQAAAQTWCPPGAAWHFRRGGPMGNFTNCDLDMVYTGDTTVLGISSKKLVATLFGQIFYSGPASGIYTQHFRTYITYQANGVLFLYNSDNARFDTVVNFKASIGDRWLRPGAGVNANSDCTSRWAFTVTDTAHITINGFSLRKITVTNPSTINSAYTYTNVFVERMLFTSSVSIKDYDLFPTYCETNSQVTDTPETIFRCYEDNSFPTYNASNEACKNFFTGIATVANSRTNFVVYPNPAADAITIDLPATGRYELKLSNLLGQSQQLAYTTAGSDGLKAGLGNVEPGIYLLQVYEGGRLLGSEKLVKK